MKKIRDEQKGIIFIILIVLVIAVVSIIFGVSLKTDYVKDTLADNQIIRILFVVEDDDSSVLFSNVMICDHETKKAAIVNLPGYVGSIFKSVGRTAKLEQIYEEAGIENYRSEVEKLLAVTIPFYCVITLDDFLKITDYLGGFRVFIPEPIDYVSETGERWLLPSGAVNLDGDKINTYLHYVLKDESRSDVQERYQNVMSAFIASMHEQKFVIFNKKVINTYTTAMQTNVEEDEEKSLVELIADVDSESIIKQTVSGSLRNVDGEIMLFPSTNGDLIKESVKQITNMLMSTDGTLSSRVYVLEIQNGTTIQGLARNTSILFQNASYDVLSAVNADRNDYDETVIIDHYGNNDVAKMVGEFIHCTNIRQSETSMEAGDLTSEPNVDFTIILGKDFNGRYVVPSRSSK